MNQSNSSLVLLARDVSDAAAWRAEYPELADAVRVVYERDWLRGLEGSIITAACVTESLVPLLCDGCAQTQAEADTDRRLVWALGLVLACMRKTRERMRFVAGAAF